MTAAYGDTCKLEVDAAVLGSGPVALAFALFASRTAPVVLAAHVVPAPPPVERVPAPLLTLLLELGVTPAELDVDHLSAGRLMAWEDDQPAERAGPTCAHVDRAALRRALWRRVQGCPDVHIVPPERGSVAVGRGSGFAGAGWSAARVVDATGRRALTATGHARPSPPWLATCYTVERRDRDATMRLAAWPSGYGYRLGSARWLTLGWVGPASPPRDTADLERRLHDADTGWLTEGIRLVGGWWSRRVASVDIPGTVSRADVVAIGDAALARAALASLGTCIGLSDARLAARPVGGDDLAFRRDDGRDRHLRSLSGALERAAIGTWPP